MTVRRHSDDHFDAELRAVANAVRTLLARRPPYAHTTELETGAIFKTIVRPSWWLLGTEMTIQLQPSSGGTQVVADTKSQLFIMGDVFGYYNRYLREFVQELRWLIERETLGLTRR